MHAYVNISNTVKSWPKKDLRHIDRTVKCDTGLIRDLHLSEAEIVGQLKWRGQLSTLFLFWNQLTSKILRNGMLI